MELLRRAAAVLARIGYSLGRYKFLFVPLDELALALLLFLPFYAAWTGWRSGFQWGHGAAARRGEAPLPRHGLL